MQTDTFRDVGWFELVRIHQKQLQDMAPGEYPEPTAAALKHAEANGRDPSAFQGENPLSDHILLLKKRKMERVYIAIIVFLVVALAAVIVVFTVANPMKSDDGATGSAITKSPIASSSAVPSIPTTVTTTTAAVPTHFNQPGGPSSKAGTGGGQPIG